MSATASTLGTGTLERLKEEFQAKGYSFIIQPRGDQLPEFLRSYRPDAVAIGPEDKDKVIIEVRGRQPIDPKLPVAELSKVIPPRSGWRYLLVYEGVNADEIAGLSRPQKSQVDEGIKEARLLEGAGHASAAFLAGWSLLEALSRRLYPHDIRFSLRPLSPLQIVERLAMEGQITDQEARRLRALVPVRHSIVHGDLNVSVSKEDLAFLLKKIETINARLKR